MHILLVEILVIKMKNSKHSLIIYKKSIVIEDKYYPMITVYGLVTLKDAEKLCNEGDYALYNGKLYVFRNGRLVVADEDDYAKIISELI